MNKTENYNPFQDQYVCKYVGEFQSNMNGGNYTMIADSARISHRDIVKQKHMSGKTEIRNEAIPRVNVAKNFSQLPKIHWLPQPNNFGEPVHHSVLRKAGPKGQHKGGNRYA